MDAIGLFWILAILASLLVVAAVGMLILSARRRQIPLERARKFQTSSDALSDPIGSEDEGITVLHSEVATAAPNVKHREKITFLISAISYGVIAAAYYFLTPIEKASGIGPGEMVIMVPTMLIATAIITLSWGLTVAIITSAPWISYHVAWKFIKEKYYLYISILLALSTVILIVAFIINIT